VPAVFEKTVQSWMDCLTPHWHFVHWRDEDIHWLLRNPPPELARTVELWSLKMQRIDSFRYFAMERWGGIYADADTHCVHEPVFPNLKECAVYLGEQTLGQQKKMLPAYLRLQNELSGLQDGSHKHLKGHSATNLIPPVENSLMASPAHHPFWTVVFEQLELSGPLHIHEHFWFGRGWLCFLGPQFCLQALSETVGLEMLSSAVVRYHARLGLNASEPVNAICTLPPERLIWLGLPSGVPKFYLHTSVNSWIPGTALSTFASGMLRIGVPTVGLLVCVAMRGYYHRRAAMVAGMLVGLYFVMHSDEY